MTYQQALAFVEETKKYGSILGLDSIRALMKELGDVQEDLSTIHIAGTNGKGSVGAMLQAVLEEAGLKVGRYSSPAVFSYREIWQINGKAVSEEAYAALMENVKTACLTLTEKGLPHPTSFEVETAAAFLYFKEENCDLVLLETGMGGNLDTTNIVKTTKLAILVSISMDHMSFLGNTLGEIAEKKAGIIKSGIPVIIGETTPETKPVFAKKAREVGAPILFAEEDEKDDYPGLECELKGLYQTKNTRTLLTAIPELRKAGYNLSEQAVRSGFAHVCELTGLMGRWQKLQDAPTLICDTGHNVGGITYITEQLKQQSYRKLHMIIGMVNDKDIHGVLALLPQEAEYYFTKASVRRALPECELAQLASEAGLQGICYPDVPSAVRAAQEKSLPEDFIFVGGSSFIVADLLANRDALNLH